MHFAQVAIALVAGFASVLIVVGLVFEAVHGKERNGPGRELGEINPISSARRGVGQHAGGMRNEHDKDDQSARQRRRKRKKKRNRNRPDRQRETGARATAETEDA